MSNKPSLSKFKLFQQQTGEFFLTQTLYKLFKILSYHTQVNCVENKVSFLKNDAYNRAVIVANWVIVLVLNTHQDNFESFQS